MSPFLIDDFIEHDESTCFEEQFVKEQKETSAVPDYGYHGTKVASIPSILSTGLKVPGQKSGVRVANGSAHGVGIYTGMPGGLHRYHPKISKNAMLSDSSEFFGVRWDLKWFEAPLNPSVAGNLWLSKGFSDTPNMCWPQFLVLHYCNVNPGLMVSMVYFYLLGVVLHE